MDEIFKALADPTRRRLLDRLFQRDGQSLSELCERLAMSRQAVTKHLKLLQAAGLISVRWYGREKLHYLNPVPVRAVYDRWINKFAQHWVPTLVGLGRSLESHSGGPITMSQPIHVYEIFIRTTPQKIWEALTSAEMTEQYFHQTRVRSSWETGAEIIYDMEGGVAVSGEVLEAKPGEKLSFTWKVHYDAELESEPPSRVSFEIRDMGDGVCRLSLVHDRFEPGSKVYAHVSKGWSAILCSLKSLLETGTAMALPQES